jgi:uncharacterized protein (TIGR03083 family)
MLRFVNDHERHCDAAEAEIARFIEVAGEADLATPLPTCPGWTVADLMRHLGIIYRWMTQVVITRPAERIPPGDLRLDVPGEESAYREWLAAGVAPLMTALREADGDEPIWTHGRDRRMRLWPWRLLAETLVHRADVELALGRTPAITTEAAADGVEEFLTTVLCYDRIVERLREFGHAGETVHLHATDGEGEWTATLGADGHTSWERGHAKGTAAIRGTAADLLLLLWGRYPLDERFAVFGDEKLLSGWLAELTV